ncbi:hypothetical protein D3C72_1995630 [compost metagenome]
MLAGWQHADDHLTAAHRLAGIAGGNATGGDRLLQVLRHQIKHLDGVACPGQVGGHGPPHVA